MTGPLAEPEMQKHKITHIQIPDILNPRSIPVSISLIR